MVGVVDTAMVGQIGTVEQAAVALSNSLYTLVLVFGLGVSYGITPLVAAADSSSNYSENAALLKHGIIINTLLGILLFVLLFAISPVLNLFDQKQAVVDQAIPFLNVMMLGMIPLCIYRRTFLHRDSHADYCRSQFIEYPFKLFDDFRPLGIPRNGIDGFVLG